MSITATSLKLPKLLKDRIFRLARRSGETPHAFMLRLLEEQVEAAERFDAFVADARKADEHMQKSSKGYTAANVHEYLGARLASRNTKRPKPIQWRKSLSMRRGTSSRPRAS